MNTRLSYSPSLLVSGCGSWPQREGRALALSFAFAAENIKNRLLALRARDKIWARLALFEGFIFGGEYIRRGLSTEGNLRFKIDWANLIFGSKFTVFALFYFVFEGKFPSTSPQWTYIWRGDLTKAFLRHIWGRLYMEGPIFGILRYMNIYAICESPLKRSARRRFAPLQKSRRNHRSLLSANRTPTR